MKLFIIEEFLTFKNDSKFVYPICQFWSLEASDSPEYREVRPCS